MATDRRYNYWFQIATREGPAVAAMLRLAMKPAMDAVILGKSEAEVRAQIPTETDMAAAVKTATSANALHMYAELGRLSEE